MTTGTTQGCAEESAQKNRNSGSGRGSAVSRCVLGSAPGLTSRSRVMKNISSSASTCKIITGKCVNCVKKMRKKYKRKGGVGVKGTTKRETADQGRGSAVSVMFWGVLRDLRPGAEL